jgi:hypothetical protein
VAIYDADYSAAGPLRHSYRYVACKKCRDGPRTRMTVDERVARSFLDNHRLSTGIRLATDVLLQVRVDKMIETLNSHSSQIRFKMYIGHRQCCFFVKSDGLEKPDHVIPENWDFHGFRFMVQHFFFFELTTPSFGLRVDNDNRALSSQPEDGGEDTSILGTTVPPTHGEGATHPDQISRLFGPKITSRNVSDLIAVCP